MSKDTEVYRTFIPREYLKNVFEHDVNFLEKVSEFLLTLEDSQLEAENSTYSRDVNICKISNDDRGGLNKEDHMKSGDSNNTQFMMLREQKTKILRMPKSFTRSKLNKTCIHKDTLGVITINSWTVEVKTATGKLNTFIDAVENDSLVWQVISEKLNIWPTKIYVLDHSSCGKKVPVEEGASFRDSLRNVTILEFPTFIVE